MGTKSADKKQLFPHICAPSGCFVLSFSFSEVVSIKPIYLCEGDTLYCPKNNYTLNCQKINIYTCIVTEN